MNILIFPIFSEEEQELRRESNLCWGPTILSYEI